MENESLRSILKSNVWPALILAVLTFFLFANTLSGDFVYDDKRQIVRNPLIQLPTLYTKALTSDVWAFKGDGSVAASNYWRPAFTGWAILNFQLFGLEPFGWHFLNILLHIGVCVLGFLLLRRWKLSVAAAFTVTLIFAVHPVHTESVAWIAGAPDLLFGVFFLGSIWFSQNFSRSRQRLDYGLALLLYGLALGSKEIAMVSFPIIWLILANSENGKDGERSANRPVVETVPFALLAGVFFFIRWNIVGSVSRRAADSADFLTAVFSAPSLIFFYLKQIIYPVALGVNYPLRPIDAITFLSFVLPVIVCAVLFAAIFFLFRRSFLQSMGAAIFALPLLPALNITAFASDQIVHDRYLYLPLFGFLMLAAESAGELAKKIFPENAVKLLWVAGIALCVPLAISTYAYNRVWKNELALWEHNVRVDPGSSANFAQLGSVHETEQRYSEAILAFNRSLDIKPNAIAYTGRARSNLNLGRFEEAIWDLRTVTGLPPESINAYTLYQSYEALAISYVSKKETGKAREVLEEARKRLPIYFAALTSKLAVVAYREGKKDEALRELESVRKRAGIELSPDSKSAIYRLGALYAEFGRREEARKALTEYMRQTRSMGDENTMADRKAAAKLLRSLY